MKQFLIHYFIPHETNNHKPYFLHKSSVLRFLAIVLALEILFVAHIFVLSKKTNFLGAVLSSTLVNLANETRVTGDLPQLRINPLLEQAAQQKAQDMAQKGYFAHTSPEGKTPWSFLDKIGYSYTHAGENLAINFYDSYDIHTAWLNSTSHRANIVNVNYKEVGIGIARGVYQGSEAIFVVEFFGTPRAIPVSIATASTPPPQEVPIEQTPPTNGEIAGIESQRSFVEIVASVPTESEILAQTEPAPKNKTLVTAPAITRIVATPRYNLEYIYAALTVLMGLALLLKIFIKIRVQHPRLILHGSALIVLLTLLINLNKFLATFSAAIY